MAQNALPCNVVERVLDFLTPQDVAFRTCLLNQTWYTPSLARLYSIIPPFSSAFQLSRACKTIIAHPEHVARSVLEFSIVHPMEDTDKIPALYYTVRAALALCTKLETLYMHTEPSVTRIILGACTFRLKTFSVIDCHIDLPTIFLSRQESLEELIIVRGDTTPLYLPRDVLPHLSSFAGIPENIIRLTQGRRLKTLRILPGPTPLNLSNTLFRLDSLVMSSLSEFHVLVTGSVLHHVTVLAQFLPRLTTVVIRYYQRNIPLVSFANVLSSFVNLREYSMISLNARPTLTAVALDSEYTIATVYHKQCPTLRTIVLRSVCWVCIDEQSENWFPRADDPRVVKLWKNNCDKSQMSTKMAEEVLRCSDGGIDEDSEDYVPMDLDGPSEDGSEFSYGEEPTTHRLLVPTEPAGTADLLPNSEKGEQEEHTKSASDADEAPMEVEEEEL